MVDIPLTVVDIPEVVTIPTPDVPFAFPLLRSSSVNLILCAPSAAVSILKLPFFKCNFSSGAVSPIPTRPVSPSTTNFPLPTLKSSPASVPNVTPIDVPASELIVSSEIFPTLVMSPSLKVVVPSIFKPPPNKVPLELMFPLADM